jgi:hypothetical protein
MSAYSHFLVELCADPAFVASAPEIRRGLDALDIEGDGNMHALALYEAVCWILNQRQHSVLERMEKVAELTALKGRQVLNMREWTGW